MSLNDRLHQIDDRLRDRLGEAGSLLFEAIIFASIIIGTVYGVSAVVVYFPIVAIALGAVGAFTFVAWFLGCIIRVLS